MTELKDLKDLNVRDVRDAPAVLALLFEGKKHEEIADALGLDRSNVTLKIHRLMDTKEFQNALTEEWVKRYREMKIEDPKQAFKQLTKLVSQTITRHLESTHDFTLTERRELVTISVRNYEDAIRAEVERALQTVGAGKQVDSTQATSKTSNVSTA